MKNPIHGGCLLAALFFANDSFAAAKPLPEFWTAIYANACVSPQSGDLYATRITIHRMHDSDLLVYEFTDGSTHAQVASELTFDEAKRTISFTIGDENNQSKSLSATLSPDRRMLTVHGALFVEPGINYVLKKVTNVLAPFPPCSGK
ncbi:MAG: hypothetical protein ACJ8GW_19325 [Massilia sp.]